MNGPIHSQHSALVIVDLQNDFCHPEGDSVRRHGVPVGMEATAHAIQCLAEACRKAAIPVLWVVTEHGPWTDSLAWRSRSKGKAPNCHAGTWGAELYAVTPAPEDRFVTKHRYSAFYQTSLELILRAQGVQTLLVGGVLTQVCVETTVRDGFMRDFDMVTVPELCASTDPDAHAMSLRNMGRYFGRVRVLADVLADLEA